MTVQQTLPGTACLQSYSAAADSFSILTESKQLFSIGIAKLFLYPVHLLKQRFFTKTNFFNECKSLPHFKQLWKTIQGGSFAYNTMLLGITPFNAAATKTMIADVTCLAILFGDEFIDGISQATGKPFIVELIKKKKEYFYLQSKTENGKILLHYQFDVRQIIPENIMKTCNPKYKITYNQFYDLLLMLLEQLNDYISKLNHELHLEAAEKISAVCNACFDTFLHDIETTPVQQCNGTTAEIIYNHTQKNRPVQYQLLDLRCFVAKRLEAMKHPSVNGWLHIITVMQYYDDMLDAVADDGYQDNIFLNIAKQQFAEEYKWFKEHKNLLSTGKINALTFSIHMPCSVFECMKLIDKMVMQMDWKQQKICNYLLRKNWFVKDADDNNVLHFDVKKVHAEVALKMIGKIPPTEIKAYLTDMCFHSTTLRQKLFESCSWKQRYQMRLNMLSMSSAKKSGIFDKAFSE